MNNQIEKAFELNTILKENIEMLNQLFGESKPADPVKQEPAKHAGRPKLGGARVPVDKGKLFALKKAGWSNKDIASELKCSEGTVSKILSGERVAAKEEGRASKV